jgi:hypothetical protein
MVSSDAHLNRSVSDTRPTIFELPACSTHTNRSARDEENLRTTDNRVSLGVHVCTAAAAAAVEEEEEEEEEVRWARSTRSGVSIFTEV